MPAYVSVLAAACSTQLFGPPCSQRGQDGNMHGRWKHVWEMATRKRRGTGSLKSLGFARQGKPQLRRQGDFSLYMYQERQQQGGERAKKVEEKELMQKQASGNWSQINTGGTRDKDF